MGLATQMIGWHEDFCEQLAERGFHVVRFDNRDIGRSTHMDFSPPSVSEMLRRRMRPEQYTLSDMAGDAAGLLRELGPGARPRGRRLDGRHDRPDARRRAPRAGALPDLDHVQHRQPLARPAAPEHLQVPAAPPALATATPTSSARSRSSASSDPTELHDEEEIRALAGRSFDRGYDARGGGRQLGAIIASGDRTRTLRRISVPTLVIHGTADRLVRPSGGRATAKAIPGARLMMVKGMGHDLPRAALAAPDRRDRDALPGGKRTSGRPRSGA